MENFAAIKEYPGFDEDDYRNAIKSVTFRVDKTGSMPLEEVVDVVASMMGYKRSGYKRTQPGGSPPRQCYVPGEDLVKRRPEINPLMRWDFDFTREDHLFMALLAMRERAAPIGGNLLDFTIGRMSVFIHWISGSDFYIIYHSCAPDGGDCKTWEEAIYKAVANFSVAVDAGLFDHPGFSGTRPDEIIVDDQLADEASQGGGD